MPPHSIAQRKFICPALPPAMLHRDALLQRLSAVIVGSTSASKGAPPYKLVLLHAPAGYGKTTLLADFAGQTTIPCCWYLLDHSDTDKTTFLERLLTCIRSSFPQFGATLDSLLAGAITQDSNLSIEQRLDTVVEALIEALETEITGRFALILYNYHEVNKYQEINSIVNTLLRHPLSCVVVIESRALPDLEFPYLLAQRKMYGLSSDFFRLNTQEIHELAALQEVAPLSEVEAEQLAVAFDGWMAGILLGTRLGEVRILPGKGSESASLLWGSTGNQVDRQFLFAYVVNEVFIQHPYVYAFLKDTCILQEMAPSICNALLDISNAHEQLYYLEQHALFVTRSGAGSQIFYTCHPVLRELLVDELRRQAPERYTQLHRRAAELFGTEQDYEHALTHAFTAGTHDLAARFILEAQEQMLLQGQAETLTRWIDALPNTILLQSPKLLLVRARLYCLVEEHARALPLLAAAEEAIAHQCLEVSATDLPTLRADIALTRASALFRRGEYLASRQVCQQVLDSLPADEVNLHAAAHLRSGTCATLLGDFSSALIHLQQALHLWGRQQKGHHLADVHSVLANLYSVQGNFALSDYHMTRALSYREKAHNVWGKTYDLIRLAVHKQRQGAYGEAEAALHEALTLANSLHFAGGQAYALTNLGELYQEQGDFERSLKFTEEGLVVARQLEDTYLNNCALCTLAMNYLSMGDIVTARLLLAETDISPDTGQTIGYERANYKLVCGTIFCFEHHYEDACLCLGTLETLLDTVGLKRIQLQTQLRLAACHLALDHIPEVVRCLQTVTTTLDTYSDYERLVLSELRCFPALAQVVKTLPEVARLQMLLHLTPESDAESTSTQAASPSPISLTSNNVLTIVQQPRLRILALGEPVVLLDEKPVTRWRMARAMELFFYLLDCGRPMRKEQILTALWPEVDDQTDHTLHSTIYYVRKALGESCIISQKGTYTLNLNSLFGDQFFYDVTTFQAYYTQARQVLIGEDDVHANIVLLAMVDLYRGDYVQPFYNDWCNLRRDELRTIYLDARSYLAQLAWRSERFEESATHWQHVLVVDSCQEKAHYGLMRCYLRQGKRGLALRQYQRCKETLQQELGVQPGPAIQNLYQRLTDSSSL